MAGSAGGRLVVVTDLQRSGWEDQPQGALEAGVQLEMLDVGGRIVMFGWTSGTVTPFTSADIAAGSLSVVWITGPRMMKRYGGLRGLETRSLAEAAAGRLLPLVHPPFPLAEAAAAHRALESRETTGKVVLVP